MTTMVCALRPPQRMTSITARYPRARGRRRLVRAAQAGSPSAPSSLADLELAVRKRAAVRTRGEKGIALAQGVAQRLTSLSAVAVERPARRLNSARQGFAHVSCGTTDGVWNLRPCSDRDAGRGMRSREWPSSAPIPTHGSSPGGVEGRGSCRAVGRSPIDRGAVAHQSRGDRGSCLPTGPDGASSRAAASCAGPAAIRRSSRLSAGVRRSVRAAPSAPARPREGQPDDTKEMATRSPQ